MPENLLKNGGFEVTWSEERSHRCLVFAANGSPQERSVENVFTPPNWLTWFRHQPGSWEQPEVREIWKQNYPHRVCSGEKAILLFTPYGKHDAGLLQRVRVTPGTRLRLTAWAHAGDSHPPQEGERGDSRPRCSRNAVEQMATGNPAGRSKDDAPPTGDPWSDAVGNVVFYAGLDPTGGVDPFAETVVWGRGAPIYDAYHEVPAVEAMAQANVVTVFLRSRTRQALGNSDAYWDDVALVALDPSGDTGPGHTHADPEQPAAVDPVTRKGAPACGQNRKSGLVEARDEVPTEGRATRQVASTASTCVLLPRIEDPVERTEWRVAAAIGCADQMWAVGHLGDGADTGPREREVIAVNPAAWERDLRAWYNEHYLNVEYREIEAATPWEMAILLLPPLGTGDPSGRPDIALAQTDRRWAHYDFGEHPSASGGTIGRYGCFMTGLAIILRKIYGRAVTPPILDKLLVAARAAYVNDNLMMWEGVVPLFPVFGESIKDNEQRSAAQLKELLRNGWEVILRQADGGHFVYLEAVEGDTLRIIDTWDGKRKQKKASDYRGIRAVRVRRRATAGQNTGDPPGHPYPLYVLLPPMTDTIERLQWRVAAAIGASGRMGMIGHSIDEAGGQASDQEVIAINPGERLADLEAWREAQRPYAGYRVIETKSPWEMAVQLMPALNGSIALSQTDPRWVNAAFGEQPGGRGETVGSSGGFLAALAITLRKVYERDVTLPALDELLVAARAAYIEDNFLSWGDAVFLFPAFDDSVKDNRRRSSAELERLLRDGWEIILRQADDGHFVYLEAVEGDDLRVIDPRDGTRRSGRAAGYGGIRAAHRRRQKPTASPYGRPGGSPLLIGLHDRRGGEWMAALGIRGCCLVHHIVQRQPIQVDCRHLANAGITVICRLNWGYADGTGTLPRPEDKDAFVNAVVQTMLEAKGVKYFHVGNEPNNRQEWPGYGRGNEFALTPQYVVKVYNEIWSKVAGRAKLGPPPLDPYFGPGSDNGEWWRYILQHIAGADALFLHAKTQTNDPAEVWSRVRFSDKPLTWQYLHLRTVETALAAVPERFGNLPVFVTELNPQHQREIGGALGWRPDSAGWVREALRYFREYGRPGGSPVHRGSPAGTGEPAARPYVAGVLFYRYECAGDQAPFGLEDKPAILAAIKEEAGA